MLSFRLHPAAEVEALEATAYIKEDDPVQAALFKEALTNAITRARRNPENYRRFEGDFRKVRVGKFTYSVVFRVMADEIQILAVMHLHREPGYWKNRAGKMSED